LVEILRFTPNSHTLTLSSILFTRDNPIFSVGLDALRSIVYKNKLKNVIITNGNIFLIVTFFVCIYPRLEHFKINLSNQILESIIQLLLSKTNVHTRHLFSLCFSNLDKKQIENLKILIHSNKLLDDYSMKVISNNCYRLLVHSEMFLYKQ
jgi:hypothetical protein